MVRKPRAAVFFEAVFNELPSGQPLDENLSTAYFWVMRYYLRLYILKSCLRSLIGTMCTNILDEGQKVGFTKDQHQSYVDHLTLCIPAIPGLPKFVTDDSSQ